MQIKSVRLAAALEARKLINHIQTTDAHKYKGPSTLEMLASAVSHIKDEINYFPSDCELRRMVLSSMSTLHY